MRAERGSIAAEWAIALPATLAVVSVLFVSSQLVAQQRRLDSLTADAVRLIGLGLSPAEAQRKVMTASDTAIEFRVDVDASSAIVCVTAREVPLSRAFVGVEALEATHCGLYVPPE